MNWGSKLVVLYTSFVVLILTLVYFSVNEDFSLVAEDYYAQEINFQSKIDKTQNSNRLKQKITISKEDNNQLNIAFPNNIAMISGEILLYRPSDAKQDKSIAISLIDTTKKQILDITNLSKGLWKIKIDWLGDNIHYFDEHTIVL